MNDIVETLGKLNTHQLRALIREFNHQDVLKSYFRLNKAELLNAMAQVYTIKNGVISISRKLPPSLKNALGKSGVKKVEYLAKPIDISSGKTVVPKATDIATVDLGTAYSKKEAKLSSAIAKTEKPIKGHRTNEELMEVINKLKSENAILRKQQLVMLEGRERPVGSALSGKPKKPVKIKTPKKQFIGENDPTNMGVRPVRTIPEKPLEVEAKPRDDALSVKAIIQEQGKEPDANPIIQDMPKKVKPINEELVKMEKQVYDLTQVVEELNKKNLVATDLTRTAILEEKYKTLKQIKELERKIHEEKFK